MKSNVLVKREYQDGKVIGKKRTFNVPNSNRYYLLRNVPEEYESHAISVNYSIIAMYSDGEVAQWFFDNIESAFRVFRMMSIGRYM